MEEANLDDFFAKKDKSKKKSKSKSAASDILAQGDEPKKKTKKKKEKKEKESKENDENSSPKVEKEEEEWADFEQEEEKDYSGLRIASLQISGKEEDGEKEEEQESQGEEEGEDGEPRERKEKGADGPWNKAQGGSGNIECKAPPSPPPEKKDPMPAGAVTGGKYVAPARRGMDGAARTPGGAASAARKKKSAPNIRSEEDFPTLGGGGAMGPDGAGKFEEVKGSGRQSENPARAGPAALELGNKFGALQDQ